MSEKIYPQEIYVCGVGWKGKESLSAVSCPDTYSHKEKYHHDDKYRALEAEVERLRGLLNGDYP